MIDVGIDIIDPIQSEAMDLRIVAREFGGKWRFRMGRREVDEARTLASRNFDRRVSAREVCSGSPLQNATFPPNSRANDAKGPLLPTNRVDDIDADVDHRSHDIEDSCRSYETLLKDRGDVPRRTRRR